MFADVVQQVSSTRIFSVMSGAGQQTLVYDARVATKVRNAMILPIPVRPGTQAAIELIDLSRHHDFFDALSSMFVEPEPECASGDLRALTQPTLEVVRVGAFEASVVPTIDDISRLSRRFTFAGSSIWPWRSRPGLLGVLRERYSDHAFVVYQIARGESRLHPFGLRFATRYPSLFFPTLHVHDGAAPVEAPFDHELYTQRATFLSEETDRAGQPLREISRNERSTLPMPRSRLPPFVETASVVRMRIGGLRPNQDTFARLTG